MILSRFHIRENKTAENHTKPFVWPTLVVVHQVYRSVVPFSSLHEGKFCKPSCRIFEKVNFEKNQHTYKNAKLLSMQKVSTASLPACNL